MSSSKIYLISFIISSLIFLFVIVILGKELINDKGIILIVNWLVILLISCSFGLIVCLVEYAIINSSIREFETISEEVYELDKHTIELIGKNESHYNLVTKGYWSEHNYYLYIDGDEYDINNSECLYMDISYVKIINKKGLNKLGEVIYVQVFQIPTSLKQ